jgi:hypothetical protein
MRPARKGAYIQSNRPSRPRFWLYLRARGKKTKCITWRAILSVAIVKAAGRNTLGGYYWNCAKMMRTSFRICLKIQDQTSIAMHQIWMHHPLIILLFRGRVN